MRKLVLALVVVGALSVAAFGSAVSASGRADELAAVRAATAKFHSLEAAKAAGYEKFYKCTDETGLGAMGQHYVKFGIVGDAIADPTQPEAVMFEPLPGGGQRLVGVEWVVFKGAWEGAGHSGTDVPQLFGRSFKLIPAPNRYGIDPFYELHAWIWKPNPTGTYKDWNPSVSCRGNGD